LKISKSVCKTCGKDILSNRAHKSYCDRNCYKKNKDVINKYATRTKAYLKKYNLTIERKFSQLKAKCELKKYELNISIEEYRILINKGCDYCGTKLDKTGVSLDRLDSKGGYTTDNVVPCCGSCNQIKNVHLTHEEMKAAMKVILDLRGRA
jgi:hypothetical protein